MISYVEQNSNLGADSLLRLLVMLLRDHSRTKIESSRFNVHHGYILRAHMNEQMYIV